MDTVTKYLNKIAWKFPKGYPDLDNPIDRQILAEEIGVQDLLEVTEDYDARIKAVLKVEDIPKCQARLSVGEDFTLEGEDKELWKELYPVLPLKKNSDVPTAGAGKGEISTYWAFQHNANPIEAQDARQSEDPDLIINDIGVELKSYETKGPITLGKFARDKNSIELLNQAFGVLSLFSDEAIQVNTGNFKSTTLLQAFKVIEGLLDSEELKSLGVAKPFYSKISTLYDKLGLDIGATAEQASAKLLRQMLWTKLKKKPNLGKEEGYILNVTSDGRGKFYKISEDSVNNIADEDILNNGVYVASSEIQMNFNRLFK